ncbi:unnamed protein product [Oppiella nova]|uniref:Uncharacterized protein n=1 Tax=Oppiella nova TaxID=334625 RepID=A0A7R9MKF8_9ACAR|nr:unnamed protein product [Oppiella nova]CAG2177860.1 unnamed protein product [Oppiella nova]
MLKPYTIGLPVQGLANRLVLVLVPIVLALPYQETSDQGQITKRASNNWLENPGSEKETSDQGQIAKRASNNWLENPGSEKETSDQVGLTEKA